MYWGRIIGGLFGLLLAGPIGVIIGIIIGAAFDRGLRQSFGVAFEAQQIFFRITFQVMGYIAKSDGRVSEQEISTARRIMQHMQLSPQQIQTAIQYFNEGKQPNFNLMQALQELDQCIRHNHILLRLFVDIQMQVATAEGTLSQAKYAVLQNICQRLGVSFYYQQRQQSHQQQDYYQPSTPPLQEDYALLEVASDASDIEIKKAYKRAMHRNHPDKLIAKGLPQSMIKMATDRTQKIQRAYERICNARGIR